MIQEFRNRRSASGEMGQGLGMGLSSGLEAMAQQQMQNLADQRQQQQASEGLQALGYTPEMATQLSQLPPQALQELVKYKAQEPSQQAYANAISQMLGQGQQQGMQQPGMQEQQMGMQDQQPVMPGQEQQMGMQGQPMAAGQQMGTPSLSGLNEKQATELAKLGMERQKMNAKERNELKKQAFAEKSHVEKQRFAEKKEEARVEEESWNKIQPKLAKWEESYTKGGDDLALADEMMDLNASGEIDSPGYVAFLKNIGLDMGTLMSPGTTQFKSLGLGFMGGAKEIYGGKISNIEMQLFLESIPSLSQSPEGRKRILAGIKNLSRARRLPFTEARRILKENNGKIPRDFSMQITEAVDRKRTKLAKFFKKDLARKVPKAQNRGVTAAQSIGGSIIGGIGGILKKALPAAIGGLVGGVPGAIGGGLASYAGGAK